MHETLPIRSARVDDLPLWLAHGARMGLQPLLDTPFPTPGHGQGRSLGGGTVIGLPHLRSPADHRLHHGEPGAETRLHTRRGCPGPPLHPLDGRDDRLARVVQALRDAVRWSPCERALTPQWGRVSPLRPARVRLERTTARGSWAVRPEGLCQVGQSPAQRPGGPQVTPRGATVTPLGWPRATGV